MIAPSRFFVFAQASNPNSSLVPNFYIRIDEISSNGVLAFVSANSSSLPFIGRPLSLSVFPGCSSGFFINVSKSDTNRFEQLQSMLSLMRQRSWPLCIQCAPGTFSRADHIGLCPACPAGTYSSLNHTSCETCTGNTWSPSGLQGACFACDANFSATAEHDNCITLDFAHAPPLEIASSVPFLISPILVRSSVSVPVGFRNGQAKVSVECQPPACKTDFSGAFVLFSTDISIFNSSSPQLPQSIIENSPSKTGSGFSWMLYVFNSSGSSIPTMTVKLGMRTSFLGALPSISSVKPSRISFLGGTVVSVECVWGAPTNYILPPNRTASCIFWFLPSSNSSSSSIIRVSVPAIGDDRVKVCVAPAVPAFMFANLSVVLQDSRPSGNIVAIESICPHSYFVDGTGCSPCPRSVGGSSFNQILNAESVRLCRCSSGSYGSHGSNCRRCPELPGFNCTISDLALPIINPGFYGDYSLLSSCSWQDTSCSAVATCPFGPAACPGGGDKVCTQNDVNCYDGRACSRCCALFYLESGNCIRCPDSNTLSLIFAGMCVAVILIAVFVSTSSSPSFGQSTKYFVIGLNFFQGIVTVKLINIEWPSIMIEMFNILNFFSFSFNVVRPECAFSWSFQTKIVLTLMLPLVLVVLLSLIGFIHSLLACKKLHDEVTKLRERGAKVPQTPFSVITGAFFSSLAYLQVNWHPTKVMWFALSPELSSRLIGRNERSGQENWEVARQKLRFLSLRDRFVGRKVHAAAPDYNLKELQQVLHDNDLDTLMFRAVFRGRKYLSGVFSILIFSFVGTLTSALSATLCEDRDGSSFLQNEPTIECKLSSSEFQFLFIISLCALVVYGVVIPSSVLLLLRSQWSQSMRIHDRNGYDALFGFLTSRYSRNYYL